MSDAPRRPPAPGPDPAAAPTRTDWPGHYLDGRTARLQSAEVRLMATGIELRTESGAAVFWPYTEIRQTQGFYAGEEVRLERGGTTGLPETLIVRDRAFVSSLHQIGRDLGGDVHLPARHRLRLVLTVGAGLGVIGLVAALYVWGIPLLARAVAARVPVAWEESLGASVVDQLARPASRCEEASRQKRIDEIVARLSAAVPRPVPYRFRVRVVDDATVNALAAPGGFMVVFRGLLVRTKSPEELAGVLAHEMQHVLQRHATKALVQHVSTGLLLVAISGDVTGVMAYGLEGARVLGALQYSRLAEEEADREGMKLLVAAGIDPAGMIGFFEGLERQREASPVLPRYLSTHPPTADRVARLRRLAQERAQVSPVPTKLFPDYDWHDIVAICAGATAR